jgi:signal transduction histidine kinase/CheY-like chemotaxis protein
MRRVLIQVYSAVLIILLVNYIYYKSLYDKQISYISELLDRQVQLVGFSVDSTNSSFVTDLNQINFSSDLSLFFINHETQTRTIEKLKTFFSNYKEFVTDIRLYDNNKNEFTLKRDNESEEWLEQPFILHVQTPIDTLVKIVQENRKYKYYLPVLNKSTNKIIGNIVVTVDYQKYFKALFAEFNLKDYQWQWVVSDSGDIVYDNNQNQVVYSQLDKIISGLAAGSVSNIIHKAVINGKEEELISSYYSTQLLQKRDLGIVFSAPTDRFQKYIIRNSIFIVVGTLLIVQLIIFLLRRLIKSQKNEIEGLKNSEKMLFKLIEEMPVGVIVHNRNREILKANKVAAAQYSYQSEADMKGKIFPEASLPGDSEYYSKNLGGTFNPDKFVILKKDSGEIVLYRDSIQVMFQGEEATMEILIDITILESARKHEAEANQAKSEFLARMSYEIRTPLNGIIGMTDVLKKMTLTTEVREIVGLLQRSSEVLLNIINDILDFSRIESRSMILDEVPYNLREEIDYCTDLAKTNIDGKDLKLNCTVENNLPVSIIGDPFRLRQILTNLLNNSIRNTENGEIQLHCRLAGREKGIIKLGFDLLDTGKSFDELSLKMIFGEFINIESKNIRTNDDSGFGTILSKQLVEIMGGELKASSPSGLSGDRGMKVSFTLPTFSNDRQIKELSFEKIKTYDKIKTLVIAGNQNRDEETLGGLHRLGLTITVTTFQRSTINQIRTNMTFPEGRYNLIVVFDDPEFNGFEAAREIWENGLSAEFIIIMISSKDKKGNILKCITMGIDHYLIKPFDISELSEIVKNSFPFLDEQASSVDIGNVRTDIGILVIEDNKMNQKVIGTMLKSLGYNYELADDGYNGYLLAKKKKFDLIFMDLFMPEMDGFESAQRILKFDNSILIIAFTADNLPETRRKAEMAGIKDFISKPVRINELKRLFARYFKK